MTITDLLPESTPFTPAAPSATFTPDAPLSLPHIPAKTALYLLTDNANTPLLLATVGNLRAALQRRLTEIPPDQKSKRIPYSQITTKILYRIVHSPFAANWFYYQAARLLFPQTYRDLISWQPATFLSINPTEKFPRFRRTSDLSDPALTYLGPLAERRAADDLIANLEDLFDLCRYHQILVQAPLGKACAYKEMAKCPAPCDGTVTLDHYHSQISDALSYLGATGLCTHRPVRTVEGSPHLSGYHFWRTSQENLMRDAAAKLNFERAAKIKSKLARGTCIEHPSFAHLRPLADFSFLSLQPGPGKPWVQPFFIHGGNIHSAPPVKKKDVSLAAPHWLAQCQSLAVTPVTAPLDEIQTEQLALVARHLFRGPDDPGSYIPLSAITNLDAIEKFTAQFFERRTPPKPMPELSSDSDKHPLKTDDLDAPNPQLGNPIEELEKITSLKPPVSSLEPEIPK